MEWVLITIAIITIFLISEYLRKRLTPKTNLLISLGAFIALLIMFFADRAQDRFTTIQLIVLVIFAVGNCFYLYYRYKKLKSGLSKK